MVWQQWILIGLALVRLPFGIKHEVERDRSDVPRGKRAAATTSGIVALLIVVGGTIALVVTI